MPRAPKERWSSRTHRSTASYKKAVAALGKQIRKLRQARGWTLEQAAEAMSMDATQLAKIEAGSLNVTLVTLVRIADGLGVKVGILFG
jgi:transcriptional regulator with XRE-family HTH domain